MATDGQLIAKINGRNEILRVKRGNEARKKRAGLLRTGSVTTLTSLITYFFINSYQTASSKVQKHYMQGHVISY